MRNNEVIRIAIAESSLIVRSGLAAALKRLPNIKVQPIEVISTEALNDFVKAQNIDVIIVNPCFDGYFDLSKFKDEVNTKGIKLIAIVTSFMDTSIHNKYDEVISIYDNINAIQNKIQGQTEDEEKEKSEDGEEQELLSQREKEVMICIVKGLTNKEIAEKLYISIHTVITHRRNISKKLEIHTVAGLTIYAIVNKLVSLDEVNIS